MICTLTARRLKPGAYEQFRAAWDPGDTDADVLARWRTIYHCRDVRDPDVVISFGLFDGSLEDLRAAQYSLGRTPIKSTGSGRTCNRYSSTAHTRSSRN